jgi:tetratricopeptide (TPR) repeat protein
MRNFWAALLVGAGFFSRAFAGFPEQFNAQFEKNDFGAMEKTLKDWKGYAPDDVEWWVASGKYFSAMAQSKVPPLSKAPAAETAVVWCLPPTLGDDPPPRNPAYFDQKLLAQAVTCWQSAIASCPWRLDIPFALARLYQDRGDFDSQYGVLIRALQYGDKNKKKLEWGEDSDLPTPRSHFLGPKVEDFIVHYLNRGGTDDTERAHRLCRVGLTYFPSYAAFYNSLAACYANNEDWPHAFKYLMIASQKDPHESLFVFNMGNLLAKIGKKREARIYYRKVVRMNQYPDCVEIARGFLGNPRKAGSGS